MPVRKKSASKKSVSKKRSYKKTSSKAIPLPSIANGTLIEDLVMTYHMRDNDEILSVMLKQKQNMDCIVDDQKRKNVCSALGFDELTDDQRVEFIRSQSKRSSSSQGRENWNSLIEDGSLKDRKAYHELRLQRLQEFIRTRKKKLLDDMEKSSESVKSANPDGISAVPWEELDSPDIERIHTWDPRLDLLFGTTISTVVEDGEPKEVKTSGIVRGFSYLFGAAEGVGKTRSLVKIMGEICGPVRTREDGVTYGGNRGLFIQAETSGENFRSTFLKGVWTPGEVNCSIVDVDELTLEDIEQLIIDNEPDFIVIDSKDMISGLSGGEGRVRSSWLHLNSLLAEKNATLVAIAHLAVSTGKIKGTSMHRYMTQGIFNAERDEADSDKIVMTMQKNRGGRSGGSLSWRHHPHGIEIEEGSQTFKSADSPDLVYVDGDGTDVEHDDLSSMIMRATAEARPEG